MALLCSFDSMVSVFDLSWFILHKATAFQGAMFGSPRASRATLLDGNGKVKCIGQKQNRQRCLGDGVCLGIATK